MFKKIIILVSIISLITTIPPALATENAANPSTGIISLTFDDGLSSTYQLAKPILDENNLTATAYIYTQPIKDDYDGYMNWSEIKELQNNSNWEIGSHSYSHPFMTKLDWFGVTKELKSSYNDLLAQGITATSFASPYGDYDLGVMTEISKYYLSHRTVWQDFNTLPANDYELKAFMITKDTSPEYILNLIQQAKQNNLWLILVFHGLHDAPSDDYFYNQQDFIQVVKHIKDSNLPVTKITETTQQWQSGTNLVNDSRFDQPNSAQNWSTNAKREIKIVSHARGAYPEYKASVKLTGGVQQYYIYTNVNNINDSQQYIIKLWERIYDLNSGSIEIWLNEFNSNGEYINGQWIGGTWANFVGNRYFNYQPSLGTNKIELYIYTPAGSQMNAYLDNVEVRELN